MKSEQKPELNKYHKRTWDSGIVLNTVLLMWPLAGFCCCSLLRSVIIKGGGNSCVTMWGEWASDQTSPSDELRVRMCWLYRLLERRSWKKAGCEGSVKIFPTCFLFPEEWKPSMLEREAPDSIDSFIYFFTVHHSVFLFIYIYIFVASPQQTRIDVHIH